MTQIKKIDFMYEIAFNKKLPAFYSAASENIEGTALLNAESLIVPDLRNVIHLVYDVPSFLSVCKKNLKAEVGFKSILQHKGYCIDLSKYCDLDTCLKERFSKSSRQLLRSAKKRLELCFNISHKIYYGGIDKQHYDELFTRFYDMLKLRSLEKGINNRNLRHWDLYTEKVYNMILNKQASLVVIYNDRTPINISLNMHLKNTVFLFITTYDIDYSKFRLGHTNWMILLDWLIKNHVKIVDFSKGNVAYKKRWANTEYEFEYHLFYDTSDIRSKMKAIWLAKKLQILQFLRNKNINTYYYKTLGWLKRKDNSIKIKNYQLEVQSKLPDKKSLEAIDFRGNNKYFYLKRIIYSYLYRAFLYVENLRVYKDLQSKDVYYFQSQKEVVKVILRH
ncbi:MAG: GNAT family N-acetyltransferase [Flavobacteriaceae bacterium]|nr:GNAT family N-acetyltransferase [Bacteroidia bacterium]NNL15084.1 GNAT family N-acetyltransferase [Flavobacteriaceae bacterium]